MNAVLLIDKPPALTSHDVVNRVRRILGQRSVGHLGTLDPLATGVLPLVIGNLTRLAQFYTGSEKTYEGVIRFGFATDTYDADGEPIGPPQQVKVSLEEIRELAGRFRGVIQQMPPPFSAKKIRGVRAYKLARKHKEVLLTPVQVEIKEFDILSLSHVEEEKDASQKLLPGNGSAQQTGQGTRVSFRARVASGTYMRSVANDMGQLLACGAHLESLRRTSVAEFDLRDAHSLEEVEAAEHEGCVEDLFVHPRKLLPQLPAVTADEESAARIRSGRTVNLPEMSQARMVKVFYGQRELIAIATRIAGTLFHARIVLAGSAFARCH